MEPFIVLSLMGAQDATLVTAEMVIFEWLATCEHPAFKPVLEMVKSHDRP